MKILRQGDVGLIPCAAPVLGVDRKLKNEKRKLIRRGENGGVHELESLEKATLVQETDVQEKQLYNRYVQVLEETRIVHKEHAPIVLQPGWYEIRIQRESFNNVIRNTAD